jgi:hypothetical protein
MNSILAMLALALCVGILLLAHADGATALLICVPLAAVAGAIISRTGTDRKFLVRLFVGALLIRMLVGTLIYVFQLQDFFGGDAFTYDNFGYTQLLAWQGDKYSQTFIDWSINQAGLRDWGMIYVVAVVYRIIGRNMLGIQFVNAVLGAATAPIAYVTALCVFKNSRVARVTALFSGFFPSLVLWSSQGLKDGPIVFLLALSMLATLKLGEKFSLNYLVVLVLSLFSLLGMRFYVFYMAAVAIVGAFIIGTRKLTAQGFGRQLVVMIALVLAFSYFGVTRYATGHLETYGTLHQLQVSRLDMAQRAGSGFGQDVDVSTAQGAISTIPLGLTYLLLAPFPWQLGSLRQMITLPEMLVWWASLPLLVLGLWFTVRHRLRQVSPILVFTTLLTLAYSVLQGNVGTAFRERAQLLVFYFIFVAVGFVLMRERREERLRAEQAAKREARLPRPLIPHHGTPQSTQQQIPQT